SSKHAVASLKGEAPRPKPKNLYTGKTYNSSEAITEFFKNRGQGKAFGASTSSASSTKNEPVPTTSEQTPPTSREVTGSSALDRLKAAGTSDSAPKTSASTVPSGGLIPGSHVRHE